MKDGPVPSNILNMLNRLLDSPDEPSLTVLRENVSIDRKYVHPHLQCQEFRLGDFLSESDVEALESTVQKFGAKTFSELRALTHDMTAYKNAREHRLNESPEMAFEDLFDDDDDAIEGAREEMIENFQLEEVVAGV